MIREFGEGFSGYEKTLWTWFVAYGIGGLIIFVTQLQNQKLIVDKKNASCIAICFLFGVLSQIIESILYKATTWYPYYRELKKLEKDERNKWWYKMSDWVHCNYWIDLLFDVGTVVFFSIATVKGLLIIMSNSWLWYVMAIMIVVWVGWC